MGPGVESGLRVPRTGAGRHRASVPRPRPLDSRFATSMLNHSVYQPSR
jgi:hypothetical protein